VTKAASKTVQHSQPRQRRFLGRSKAGTAPGARPVGTPPRSAAPVAREAAAVAAESGRRSNAAATDEQLVSRAQEGDTSAFERLFKKHQSRVVQLASYLVGESDAPDVAQEAFIKAYRALPSFRGDSAFYTWLYRIALNSAKNHLNWRARRPKDQDVDVADAELAGHTEHLSDMNTPEATLMAEELSQKIATAIQRLPQDLRRAVLLRELSGLSYDEIAELMDCPIGTVRSRLFRAREVIDAATPAV